VFFEGIEFGNNNNNNKRQFVRRRNMSVDIITRAPEASTDIREDRGLMSHVTPCMGHIGHDSFTGQGPHSRNFLGKSQEDFLF